MRTEFSPGLELRFKGEPAGEIRAATSPLRSAILGADYPNVRMDLLTGEGQKVALGAPLSRDRRHKDIVFTAPVAGVVSEIRIGARRQVTAIILTPEGDNVVEFDPAEDPNPDAIRQIMLHAGLWPALRSRPFDRVPDPGTSPDAIFVKAIDTAPHAPDPALVLAGRREDFARGVAALEKLTNGPVFVCQSTMEPLVPASDRVLPVRFTGPHPAGLVGAHILRLFPLRGNRTVWHINYQDVAALGALLATGSLDAQRVVTLGGPGLRDPGYVHVPLGVDMHGLVRHDLTVGNKRVLSGSLLDGREGQFLSRYHLQLSVAERVEQRQRNWLMAALYRATAPAAFVPTESVLRSVAPELAAVPLLRALSVLDAETAERLGCLHLAEEDLALATYATGGAVDFRARLRTVLDALAAA